MRKDELMIYELKIFFKLILTQIKRWIFRLSSIFIMAILGIPVLSYAQEYSSGKQRVGVIELYSSEGCSSCPPADRWLATLKEHPKLWKDFIPMEFHVDYWNRLGWVDRFSREKFTNRQKKYTRILNKRSLVTPEFIINGKDVSYKEALKEVLKKKKVGKLNVSPKQKLTFESTFSPITNKYQGKHLVFHAAILGHGLKTKVHAGENAGKLLKHEFVVLSMEKKPFNGGQGIYRSQIKMKPDFEADPDQFSVVFWVSEKQSPTPIQAVGGYLKEKKLIDTLKLKDS